MTRSDSMARVIEIMRDIFDQDNLIATEATTADDVSGWDSTNHVRLMVAIEDDFGIRFETSEISAPDNVGELLNLIQSKVKS